MNKIIIILLSIPLVISLGYLLTHPMPPNNAAMLKQLFSGEPVVAENRNVKENWRMHLFKKAPVAGDPGIPAGNHVRIETGKGSFLIKLYPHEAPNTVANFKALAGKGFYDGLTFHRVIPGFVAQGGDPMGDGAGGPGYHIKAEFNSHKHITGAVAMARSSDPDSAGSQFYICYGAHPHLDGQYTVFGQVVEGQDIVDKITKGTVMKKVSILP